jgi:hypothetical protein
MHSSLLVLVEVTEFHTTEAYCNLDLINVLCNIRRLVEERKRKRKRLQSKLTPEEQIANPHDGANAVWSG